jgi:hypothetical protein
MDMERVDNAAVLVPWFARAGGSHADDEPGVTTLPLVLLAGKEDIAMAESLASFALDFSIIFTAPSSACLP